MAEKKRARYLDVAKGIGILCIVLLHVEEGVIPGRLNVFIGSFMISLFFITTGWLDAQRPSPLPLGVLVRKRWKQLAIPYLWWSGLILLFDIVLWIFGYYNIYFIGREVYKTIILRGIGTLWFLPALFGGEIIWNVIRRKKTMMILAFAIVLTLVTQNIYAYIFNGQNGNLVKIIQAPFYTLNNILVAWIGILAGYVFRRVFEKLRWENLNKGMYLMMGIGCCVAAYFAANDWPIPILWGIGAPIIGPIGILFLSMGIEKMRVTDYLNYWGRNSMALMVTHYSFLMVGCDIVNRVFFHEPKITGYSSFIYFFMIMIFEYYITEFLLKKYPFLFGK